MAFKCFSTCQKMFELRPNCMWDNKWTFHIVHNTLCFVRNYISAYIAPMPHACPKKLLTCQWNIYKNNMHNFQLKKKKKKKRACTNFTFLRLIISYKFISKGVFVFGGEFSHLGDQRKKKPMHPKSHHTMRIFILFLKSSHLDKRF